MTKDKAMSEAAQRIFALSRSGDNPTDSDKKRVWRGLERTITVGVASSLAANTAFAAARWWPVWAPKAALLALVTAGTGGGVYVALTHTASRRPAALDPTSELLGRAAPTVAAADNPVVDAPASAALAPTPRAVVAPTQEQLLAEARLLRQAQQALRDGLAARSLATLAQHERRFPDGALAPERDAARVFAYCLAKQLNHAKASADAFVRAHPNSPLLAKVKESCAR